MGVDEDVMAEHRLALCHPIIERVEGVLPLRLVQWFTFGGIVRNAPGIDIQIVADDDTAGAAMVEIPIVRRLGYPFGMRATVRRQP